MKSIINRPLGEAKIRKKAMGGASLHYFRMNIFGQRHSMKLKRYFVFSIALQLLANCIALWALFSCHFCASVRDRQMLVHSLPKWLQN